MSARHALTCDEVRDLAPMFVTGALDPDEMHAVREHLLACSDVHEEIQALGEAAVALLDTVSPVEPPPALKGRLLAAAAADLAAGRHPSAADRAEDRLRSAGPAAPVPVAAQPPVPISIAEARRRRRPRIEWLLAAAAAIAVIALGGWNLALQRELGAAQAYRDGVSRALEMAAKPGSLTALLVADDGTVSGLGVVGGDGTVRLAMRGLNSTSGAQVYTAWSIVGDAAPVPIGEFTVGADGVAVVTARAPVATAGAVLALTLEPAPGARTPTLPIVAAGVTRAPAG